MIHVVLGMHKSGTSLVAELLHHAGIAMVDEVDSQGGYDDGNKWERESTLELNQEILGSAGAFSLDARGERRLCGAAERQRMRDIIAACSTRHTDWGFKDPRTCLTYDLWAAELPAHRVIAVFRSPEEAWAHYWRAASLRRRLKTVRRYLPQWCAHNTAILAALDRTPHPFLVLDYARLIDDPSELARLERFVGRPLVDRRDPRMRRSRKAQTASYRAARAWHRLWRGQSSEEIAARLDALRTA